MGGYWTFPPSNTINGNRTAPYFEAQGWPDQWIVVEFAAPATIDTINVFSVQDGINVPAPEVPGAGTVTTLYGITAFTLAFWDGSAWVDIPGGNVTGNNYAWRQITFAPLTTTRVRLMIHVTQDNYVRVNELEVIGELSPAIYGVGRLASPFGTPRGRAIVAPLGVARLGSPLGSPTGRGAATARPLPSLLPAANRTPLELAIEQVIAARLAALMAPLRTLWSAADCPAAFLGALAWGLSVDEWDPLWGEARRRAVVAAAIGNHRIKGTVASVRRALAAVGYPAAVIQEGTANWLVGDGSCVGYPGLKVGSSGAWAEYRVGVGRPITTAQAASVRRILEATAPARCRLVELSYQLAPWVIGDGTRVGDAEAVVYL